MARKIMPPTYLWVAMAVMVILHFVFPIRQIIGWPYRILGIIPLAVGAWANLWASALYNRVRTTIKPFERATHLCTDGFYRFTRHPMYVGMVAVAVGLAILLGSIGPLIPVVALVIILERFMCLEERDMAATFGDAYCDYASRVRRWL